MYHRAAESLRREFLLQHLLPMAVLLACTFGGLFALLFNLTAIQDRMELSLEIERAENVLRNATDMVVDDLEDYAQWDDAVVHAARRIDPLWVDRNVSAYLQGVDGYSFVFVASARGRTLYAYAGGSRSTAPAVQSLGRGFTAGLAKLSGAPMGAAPIVTGFTRSGDKTYVFGVASIVPLSTRVARPPGPPNVLVVAAEMDQPFLDRLSRGRRAPKLSLAGGGAGASASVGLRAPDGDSIGHLRWSQSRPGTALRHQIFPAFLLAGAIALVAAGLLLRRSRRIIEALRASEAAALHNAFHDPLTGLPNRRAMIERLAAAAARRERVSLLYMDLDGFKGANDRYGHVVGDAVLVEAGRRIAAVVGEDGLVARTGGDEFAAVLGDHPAAEGANLAKMIVAAFQTPFAVDGVETSVGVSVGLAASRDADFDQDIVRRADVAMYAAKAAGKNGWRAYAPAMDAAPRERPATERRAFR